MRKPLRDCAVAMAIAVLSACGGARAPRADNPAIAISEVEIEKTGLGNGVEVVRRLRPEWLRNEGRSCILAWRDRDRVERVDWTRLFIPSDQLASIRYTAAGRADPTGVVHSDASCSHIQFLFQ